jgi:O-Antigen ligase
MSLTTQAHTPARASGKADGGRDVSSRGVAAGLAGLLLLTAATTGLLGQGAFYTGVRWYVGVLVAAATVLALVAWPPTRDDARLPPVVAALALAAWAVLDAALVGVPAASAAPALLLLGVVAVLLVCRRLGPEDREILLLGVVGIGLLVALAGWLGVAGRVGSWAWLGDGVWRASSTLTYPNAAAAVLVPVALLVLAWLVDARRSLPFVLAATGLLTGLGATMSRAAALALAVGLVVLAGLRGPRKTARAALGPCVGALVALGGLVPSMPAARPPRPALALAGLCAGLALAALVARLRRWPAVTLVLGGALVGCLAAAIVIGGLGDAARLVAQTRITLASPDRSGAVGAALRVAAEHPLTGAGPGQADLRSRGADGGTQTFGYAHNEYAQVAAELGLVGLGLLAVLLVALGRMLWCARAAGSPVAGWAGVIAAAAAFAVHSGFDFVWHLPAVVLTVLLLVGVILPAPHGADARTPFRTALGKESDENKIAR